jgi:hypothetical protein
MKAVADTLGVAPHKFEIIPPLYFWAYHGTHIPAPILAPTVDPITDAFPKNANRASAEVHQRVVTAELAVSAASVIDRRSVSAKCPFPCAIFGGAAAPGRREPKAPHSPAQRRALMSAGSCYFSIAALVGPVTHVTDPAGRAARAWSVVGKLHMADTTRLAELTTRAADLADRVEAAGALVAASVLRGIAIEVEEFILKVAPPDVGWQRRVRARPCR